jgi:2-polyprenyl-3-methyl-5-hydroxy-6-metoxy-1,4-benzoquinol methylase
MQTTKKNNRGFLQKILDSIFFPLRSLFIPEENMFGLTSLREERFENVVMFCKGRVLDIGCGRNNLFVKTWVKGKNNLGIDIFPYEGVNNIYVSMKDKL